MEALLLRYDYVTRATSDAIRGWDLESGSLYWAEGFAKIFGYCLIALNNDISSWTGPIHPDDLERVLQSIHETIAGSADNWKEEYEFRRANGCYADVVDRGFVIRNAQGKAIRMVGAMHDISERKSAIRDLKQLADDLYERNGELQHFGYVVSHNLRSHVANIMGLTNLLELADNDLETGEKCITELKTSVNRLDDVIKDLSKIYHWLMGR
jgi:PAS domain S-box-containing protein